MCEKTKKETFENCGLSQPCIFMINQNIYCISFLWLCFIKHSNGTHTQTLTHMVFTGSASDKESACQLRRCRKNRFNCLVRKIQWSRKWQPTPVLLPGLVHGQSSLVVYCPLAYKESDTTEQMNAHAHTHTFINIY